MLRSNSNHRRQAREENANATRHFTGCRSWPQVGARSRALFPSLQETCGRAQVPRETCLVPCR